MHSACYCSVEAAHCRELCVTSVLQMCINKLQHHHQNFARGLKDSFNHTYSKTSFYWINQAMPIHKTFPLSSSHFHCCCCTCDSTRPNGTHGPEKGTLGFDLCDVWNSSHNQLSVHHGEEILERGTTTCDDLQSSSARATETVKVKVMVVMSSLRAGRKRSSKGLKCAAWLLWYLQ